MKYLFLSVCFAVLTVTGLNGVISHKMPEYITAFTAVQAALAQPATPTFQRGYTDLQGQPCDDQRGGVDYKSVILSRAEVVHELQTVGFTGQPVEQMASITLAESGRQLSCIADEHLTDWKWDVSYGAYSIRAVKAEQGTGSCRDIDRLRKNDFHDQTLCAWEISGHGKTLSPWSTFTNGRWKKYQGQ